MPRGPDALAGGDAFGELGAGDEYDQPRFEYIQERAAASATPAPAL
jgi:hypothetical protein